MTRHVFLSYVHEDEAIVGQIRDALERWGISVWMDRTRLHPGDRWKDSIRAAIRDGAFFIACFSPHALGRQDSYMNEELAVAIEELGLRSRDRSWFLPVRLGQCAIPRQLRDLHSLDLFPDFDAGMEKLVNALLAGLLPDLSPAHVFALGLRQHIAGKLQHFTSIGAALDEEIVDKWVELLDERRMGAMITAFSEAHKRMQATGRHQLDMLSEPGDDGKVILLSIAPNKDLAAYLRSLPAAPIVTGNVYMDFMLGFRRSRFHRRPGWKRRDFAHVLYFHDAEDDLLVMLFFEAPRMRWARIGAFVEEHPGHEPIAFAEAMIYPTSLLSAIEAAALRDAIDAADVGA